MVEFHPVDAFLVLLIGLGPIKALISLIALTSGMENDAKRRVAITTVTVAGAVAIGLLVLGRLVQEVLHFSDEALVIAGGLILLLLALHMVLGQGAQHPGPGATSVDPTMVAVFPLALPLTLNPIGIVALITYSGTTTVEQGFVIAGLGAVVLGFDLGVYLLAGRLERVAPALVSILEIVLGILLAALAVQLILVGLAGVGIAEGVTHG